MDKSKWAFLVLAITLFLKTTGLGQAPVISSFSQNGVLVCTNLPPGSVASVEWASSLAGPWQTNWAGLGAVTVASNGTITVSVPMYYRVRGVVALNVTGPGGVAFASIPAGTYQMGDNLDGMGDAPVTSVTLSGYWLQTTETTWAQWNLVRTWGLTNGYTDISVGAGKATNHPMQSITWYDVVKWCNAASEREGLVPCYYTDTNQTVVYRTGNTDINNLMVKWGANGYRLPTEAEWEVAARGGLSGKRFPWGDTISESQANYYGYTGYSYDFGPNGFNSTYVTGGYPYTSPVGSFAANGYGLYDMAGNVWEWCWDWDGTYNGGTNPQGPMSGTSRVIRGGVWFGDAFNAQCARRNNGSPDYGDDDYGSGFRLARGRP